MQGRLITPDRLGLAIGALVFASGLSLSMLAARVVVGGRLQLGFYLWNLILAWMPLCFALCFCRLKSDHSFRWPLLALFSVSWFLFFPNAPYLVTDLLHLAPRPPVPMWFDVVMMVSFAWTGLLLGYLSLFLMQEAVRLRLGSLWSWSFAGVMLALSSFGIYLGRFERWNSWDVLTNPLGLGSNILGRLNFLGHPRMTAFCLTFFAFSLLSYATLYALTHLHHSTPAPNDAAGR